MDLETRRVVRAKTCQSGLTFGPRRNAEEDQVKEKAAEVNKKRKIKTLKRIKSKRKQQRSIKTRNGFGDELTRSIGNMSIC